MHIKFIHYTIYDDVILYSHVSVIRIAHFHPQQRPTMMVLKTAPVPFVICGGKYPSHKCPSLQPGERVFLVTNVRGLQKTWQWMNLRNWFQGNQDTHFEVETSKSFALVFNKLCGMEPPLLSKSAPHPCDKYCPKFQRSKLFYCLSIMYNFYSSYTAKLLS